LGRLKPGNRNPSQSQKQNEQIEINGGKIENPEASFEGMVSPVRIERTTHALKGRCSTK
jgi:hypothetical protein